MKQITRAEFIEKRQQAETGFTNLDLSGLDLSMMERVKRETKISGWD